MPGRCHAVAGQRAALGGSGKQRGPHAHEAFQRGNGTSLPIAVEVDQHVAEKDEVERTQPVDQCFVEQIPRVPAHLRAQGIDDAMMLADRREIPVAKLQGGGWTAKGIAAVDPRARHRERALADVQGIDGEFVGPEARIEQGHRHRIRLFTGGARQAQQTQRLRLAHRASPRAPFILRHFREGRESVAMPEEPCLRHHKRLDQRLQFVRRLLQSLPIQDVGGTVACFRPRFGERGKPGAHRPLHRVRAERLGIEAHRVAQQALDVAHMAHGDSPDAGRAAAASAIASRAASKSRARAASVSN
ncbi:hypothetical protein PPN31119_04234 [Pandoraea pnomenusa]|uniref:Uncharacterized protein n=1 Tax=Pandoraea pnomenusa TaxID=93220 RepID=A0ABY6WTD4_9BURK|nr:hypothetical protein PPN31119_04234 [Pandoraea pnomenusa]